MRAEFAVPPRPREAGGGAERRGVSFAVFAAASMWAANASLRLMWRDHGHLSSALGALGAIDLVPFFSLALATRDVLWTRDRSSLLVGACAAVILGALVSTSVQGHSTRVNEWPMALGLDVLAADALGVAVGVWASLRLPSTSEAATNGASPKALQVLRGVGFSATLVFIAWVVVAGIRFAASHLSEPLEWLGSLLSVVLLCVLALYDGVFLAWLMWRSPGRIV